jgi:FAD:protein FMN transferase
VSRLAPARPAVGETHPDGPTSVQFEAFGSIALVSVARAEALPRARAAVERVVANFDQACSRFRADSELSRLNAAGGQPREVTPLLLEAVSAALRAARLTDGDVDPTIGTAMIALGYDRDFAQIPARKAPVVLAAVRGWQALRVDRHAKTITVPADVKLDLGATAKALAADHAAAAAGDATGAPVLVSLGGDIAVAGVPAPEGAWRIRVADHHRAGTDAPGQWIALRSGGLATSSTVVRAWSADAHRRHHLVDPATGGSASSEWRTVSVAAASCLDANIASTAAIIRSRRAPGWLAENGLPSRLVTVGGRARHVAGWPADGDDLA